MAGEESGGRVVVSSVGISRRSLNNIPLKARQIFTVVLEQPR